VVNWGPLTVSLNVLYLFQSAKASNPKHAEQEREHFSHIGWRQSHWVAEIATKKE